jgi:hypothetical protein
MSFENILSSCDAELAEWTNTHSIIDLLHIYLIPQGFTTLESVFVGITDYVYVCECGIV